jgi:hypothetical protein
MAFKDRGDPLEGVNKTIRDSRVPYTLTRSMENFALPDKRARRRPGYSEVFADRVRGQMLCKSTGVTLDKKFTPSLAGKQDLYKTPLSYAVIRHHSAYRLTTVDDWTLEFYCILGDHEPLVVEPFARRARKTTGAPTWNFQLRTPGVYLLDQTLLSNFHTFDPGTTAAPSGDVVLDADLTSDPHFDAFPLTTIAISFTKTQLQVCGCPV